jgi:hypothetical protein
MSYHGNFLPQSQPTVPPHCQPTLLPQATLTPKNPPTPFSQTVPLNPTSTTPIPFAIEIFTPTSLKLAFHALYNPSFPTSTINLSTVKATGLYSHPTPNTITPDSHLPQPLPEMITLKWHPTSSARTFNETFLVTSDSDSETAVQGQQEWEWDVVIGSSSSYRPRPGPRSRSRYSRDKGAYVDEDKGNEDGYEDREIYPLGLKKQTKDEREAEERKRKVMKMQREEEVRRQEEVEREERRRREEEEKRRRREGA